MRYTWMDEYLLNKRGVTKDLQPSWNWIRYMVGGKMFAAVCLDSQDTPYYINLKLEPMYGAYLRSKYDDVIPGYYSDKQHWNSVKPDGVLFAHPGELPEKAPARNPGADRLRPLLCGMQFLRLFMQRMQ